MVLTITDENKKSITCINPFTIKEREKIINLLFTKFFKNKPFGDNEKKILMDLAGVYDVDIDLNTGLVKHFNLLKTIKKIKGNIDYSSFKNPKITLDQLSNSNSITLKELINKINANNKEENKPVETKDTKKHENVKTDETKTEVDKESKEENKQIETKDTKNPENVKTEEPKTEIVVTSTPDEKLLVDTSGITDKWNKKTVSDFNSFLDSIKQIEKYSDNEKENKTIKENFNNLKLIGFKGKLDEYMTCVLYNIKSNIIFELFKRFNKDENTNESEIACFYDVFDFKSTSYKRQSEARQKPNKKERDEYLNQYCYVDFKLLPKEEKLA